MFLFNLKYKRSPEVFCSFAKEDSTSVLQKLYKGEPIIMKLFWKRCTVLAASFIRIEERSRIVRKTHFRLTCQYPLERNSTLRHYKSHDQLTGSIEIAKAVSNRWRFLKSQPFSLGISSSRYEFQYSVFCLNLHDIWRNALLLESLGRSCRSWLPVKHSCWLLWLIHPQNILFFCFVSSMVLSVFRLTSFP